MKEILILTSFVVFISIVIALIVTLIENNEKKKNTSTPLVYTRSPLTYGEVSEQMFNAALERFLRTKYGENFYCWKYQTNRGEVKRLNDVNTVLVTLKNGITSSEVVKTKDVINSMGFGNVYKEPVAPEEQNSTDEQEIINESSPVEDWISEHAADIVTKVEKSLKNNYISILYPVSEEYVSLIDEIVEKLNDRMPYEVTVSDESKLKINFENLLAYDE